MRKALLQRVVGEAVASSGSPVACCSRAPATSTPATTPSDDQKPQRVISVSNHLSSCSSERSADEAANVEPHVDSIERSAESARRFAGEPISDSATPLAEAGEQGRDLHGEGHMRSPSQAELVEVLRCMLTGDAATPRRSDCGWAIALPTTSLAVLVVDAVEALYKELGVPKGKSLPCTTGPVDREEAYGYLMADVLGSALLSAEGGRFVGDRTRKRSAAHAAALPEAKKQAKKQAKRDAKKTGEEDVAKAEADAAAASERKLLGAEFKLQLPPPMPAPKPPQPAQLRRERKRAREAEQRSEFDDPSLEEQLAAYKAAHAELMRAMNAELTASELRNAALEAENAAWSRAEQALAKRDAEPNIDANPLDISASEDRRLDALRRAFDHRAEKAEQAERETVALQNLWKAANTETLRCHIVCQRISDWIRYPDVITPFPWPDGTYPYVVPCNWDDLNYYETAPRGYPAGVREWRVRFEAHMRSIGLPVDW
jgi:hypothetical protein